MRRAAGQEAGQRAMEIRLVQQEGVVALVGWDFDEADIGPGAVQRAGDRRGSRRSGTASPR